MPQKRTFRFGPMMSRTVLSRAAARSSLEGRLGCIWLTANEREAHLPLRVVDVQIDEHDALPRAQLQFTAEHRDHERRTEEGGQYVIGAVPRGTVTVHVVPVAR